MVQHTHQVDGCLCRHVPHAPVTHPSCLRGFVQCTWRLLGRHRLDPRRSGAYLALLPCWRYSSSLGSTTSTQRATHSQVGCDTPQIEEEEELKRYWEAQLIRICQSQELRFDHHVMVLSPQNTALTAVRPSCATKPDPSPLCCMRASAGYSSHAVQALLPVPQCHGSCSRAFDVRALQELWTNPPCSHLIVVGACACTQSHCVVPGDQGGG